MALRGFVRCADGRLYHRVLCLDVARAWGRRQQYVERRERDAERLRNWRTNRTLSETEWANLRSSVFRRDKFICTKCGSTEDLHCDHIVDAADGGRSEMQNLTTLCRSCHGTKTAKTRYEMQREMHFTSPSKRTSRRSTEQSRAEQSRAEQKKERKKDIPPVRSPPLAVADDAPPDGVAAGHGKTNGIASNGRGHRLPVDWQPSEADREFAMQCGIADIAAVVAEFADYWRGIPGNKGLKLDWSATWRNRCREVAGRRSARDQHRPGGLLAAARLALGDDNCH